mmetsp:Transcript_30515/g.51545  ORF Transcript_30515/g.51545 Transcript_30515/m.51545 type:complete len:154 (+) Transcript_30515:119-580(+)|eukprot:CAMPEP_0174993794 /NCGR_PEP_ID=MMETSP0004_2-20121128/23269_1 /TAXON_ID=420556 /ORGANISM="Ochromonas sp., Strain CCMP1393" /LENGTH=153 /DNA_ID=CAMNT_0016247941 /DNA_START=385 /DNA_END=846 /DNA_ORIENTATION=+
MGNAEITSNLFTEYESTTARRLLTGITNKNLKQVEDAVEYARKQHIIPNLKKSYSEDYADMTEQMLIYLTRKYDVGDGILFKKTPIQYAQKLAADDIVAFLNDTVIRLERKDNSKVINQELSPATSAAVGEIDADRVSLAKARLMKIRNDKKS